MTNRKLMQGQAALLIGGGSLVLIVLFVLNLTQGETGIDVRTVVRSLAGSGSELPVYSTIREFRLPRAVAGLLSGAALAVAGAMLQTALRNPLASAGTLGINAGAYFAVAVATVFAPAWMSAMPIALALTGGIGALVLVYWLSGGRRGTPVRTVLSGMIVTMVFSSFTNALQILYETQTTGVFAWGAGNLVQNDWQGVRGIGPLIAAGIVAALLMSRSLDLLALDDDSARSLGGQTARIRTGALALAVLLASLTVSIAGPIGFIGLLAPHLVKLVGCRKHRTMLAASALWGANLLLFADMLTHPFRSAYGALPVGAVTALIGAPWLIWLAVRGMKGRIGEHPGRAASGTGNAAGKIPFPYWAGLFAAALALLLFYGCVSASGLRIPLEEVWAVLGGQGEELARSIVLNMRLPRMLLALFAGASLAVSGLLLQGALRNPLADPSLIGVTTGAGVGVLLLNVLWPQASISIVALSAFTGGVAAAAFVYTCAWRQRFSPSALILVGLAVTAIGSACTQFLVLRSASTASSLLWLVGSTYARGWQGVVVVGIASAVLLPAAWLLGRRVDLLAFEETVPKGLGLPVQRTRIWIAVIAVGLSAFTVSVAGALGFVGLLAPHAARMLVGYHHRRAAVLSALLGALLLVAADIAGRTLFAPKEFSSGLMVSLIGAPYLLFLLYRGASAK